MKNLLPIFLIALCGFSFVTAVSAQCEGNVYTASLTWQMPGAAHGFTSTELDYCAGLYYDPANSGSFVESFDSASAILGEGYTEGVADTVPAALSFDYLGPINNGTYTTNGNHYVIAYYQVYVPQFSEYMWYDPWNLGFEEIDNESFIAPDDYAYFGYVTYWASSPQFVGNTSDAVTYTGQTQCLPGQQFTPSGQPCSSLPGCESGLQFSSTGETCPNYVPQVEPLGVRTLTIAFDNIDLLPAGIANRPETNTKIRACIVGESGTNSGILITLEPEDVSGITTGHIVAYHDGKRPLGKLGSLSGYTNAEGCFVTTYYPEFVSGKIRVNAHVSGFSTAWDTAEVGVSKLARLYKGTNYRLNGSGRAADCDAPQCTSTYMSKRHRKAHESNHWVVAPAIPALKKLADDYKQQFYGSGYIPPSEMVTYNDASLAWGGKFHLGGKTLRPRWLNSGSHADHREGKNIDTKSQNIPSSRHPAFVQLARDNNFGMLHHKVVDPHYHFTWGDLRYRTTVSVLQNGIDPNMNAFSGTSITTSNLASNAAETILGRSVTQAEFELWRPQLTSAKSMGSTAFLREVKTFYQQVFASQEYVLRDRTDEEFVQDVFNSHLFREPTESELSHWMGYLLSLQGNGEPTEPELPDDPRTRAGSNIGSTSEQRQIFLVYFQTVPQFVDIIGNVANDTYSEPIQ